MVAVRNRFLCSLPPDSLARLRDKLEWVELPIRQMLVEPNEPTRWIHFLESGLASVVASWSAPRFDRPGGIADKA